jgi:hypothetical protein
MKGHEIAVSRLKLVLIVVCLIAIPLTFWLNHRDVGSVNSRVTKVESPCLRYGAKSPQCKAAFEAAVATITHPEACAVERKAGTLRAIRELAAGLDVTFTEPCAGARLAQERQRGNERAATAQAHAGPSRANSPSPTSTGGGSTEATGGLGSGHGNGTSKGTSGGTKQAPKSHEPQPKAESEPASTEAGTDTTSTEATTTESTQSSSASSTSEAPPGLIGNPGGAVGNVACGLGEVVTVVAGVHVCTK